MSLEDFIIKRRNLHHLKILVYGIGHVVHVNLYLSNKPRDTIDEKSLSNFPGWTSIMGLQFENLVLNNRKRIWEILEIKADEIIWDNSFFQQQTSKAWLNQF